MRYSLRRVLAVRFSLTMLIALALIALWALLAVERTLRQQTDVALASTSRLVGAGLGAGLGVPRQDGPRDFATFVSQVNRFVVLRDPAGAVVQANTPLALDLPLDAAALARAQRGETTWASQRWAGGWIRSFYAPAPQAGDRGTLILEVAASLEPLAEANRQLLIVVFGTVLLGTLATAFGASWLARSAVQPVIEVAAQAREIQPDTGEKRITAHADVAEYQSLIGVLNDLLARCEAAFASQRRFIGDVGHELRTPLTSLQGQIEVALRSDRTPRDYQLVLRGALEEIEHLGRMSDSLMLITQAESNALEPHRTPTDLNDITRGVLEGKRHEITSKDLEVRVRLEYDGPPPALDARLVARALRELVDNAIKFSPHGGRMTVGTAPVPGGVRWWVEDSGPGILPEDVPRLFEPFYRVDPARTRDHGSGLGLTVAACITRLHRGTIRSVSTPGGGARFDLEFPLSALPAAA